MNPPKKLSDTARALLTLAATRDDHLIRPPQLPLAAARQVVRSLLNAGSAEEVTPPIEDAEYIWRTSDDDRALVLQATDLGLSRVGEDEDSPHLPKTIEAIMDAGTDAGEKQNPAPPIAGDLAATRPSVSLDAEHAQPGPDMAASAVSQRAGAVGAATAAPLRAQRRTSLRLAAQSVLDDWDASACIDSMNERFAALRAALAVPNRTSSPTVSPRRERNTKQAQVLAMLGRNEGASGPQIAEAMGWAPHTVRGFLAGLGKKGFTVTVLDRVRQVGPHSRGAQGSYTVYCITDTIRP